jgi:putative tryptophan/tyrosine transport system substrate-binding protein
MMRRRDIIVWLGGAAVWPFAPRAQQPALPVVGFVNGGAADAAADRARAFREGLGEAGYVEGRKEILRLAQSHGRSMCEASQP